MTVTRGWETTVCFEIFAQVIRLWTGGSISRGAGEGGGAGCNWLYGCIPPESYSVFQAGCIYIAEISHVENVNELILNWALVTQADNTLAGEKPAWSQLVVFQVFSITHLRLFCFLSTGSLLSCVTLFLAVWRFVKTWKNNSKKIILR